MSLNLENGHALTFATALTAAGHVTGITGAATTHSTPLLAYSIAGDAYTKAAAAGTASPTTDVNTSAAITLTAGYARSIVWGVNAAGTVKVAAGPLTVWGDQTAGGTALLLPPLPADFCPIAVMTLQGASTLSGTWTFGSSNWNATGLTIGTGKSASISGGAARSVVTLPYAALLTA